ncbi:MAG TPA: DUF1704 domain-containing protein [Chromatiales bacterium]|nr:DUF1704 domain-containing protein [Thiotrichales bacterium]HIP67761.1 DUF1704 domain-containing protein [Chromatiales bacterium]
MTNINQQSISSVIDRAIQQLQKNNPVRVSLPDGSQIHIDRQLPFLCIYRQPAGRIDTGTDQLITSQSAYILTSAAPEQQADIKTLIKAIAEAQVAAFGTTLLLELWTADTDSTDNVFHIVAPDQDPPEKLLETMENALLRVTIHRKTPKIKITYQDKISPPGLPPLLDKNCLANCHYLGLEINPVFRERATGEIFAFGFKAFRQRFNRALKHSFFSFAHEYTTHRPAHYHALGPRAITRTAQLTGHKLAEISHCFDLLLHVSPVNTDAAWESFKRHNYGREVQFHYRPRTIDPDLLKRQLFQIPIENIEDPTLANIFAAKRNELDRQITLVADRNTPRFLLGSRQLFGDVEPDLLQLAQQIMAKTEPPTSGENDDDVLDSKAFAAYARKELDYYRGLDPELSSQVEIRPDIPGIMVSRGNFLIGASAKVPQKRVNATLAHEIGTHVLTWHNGQQQSFRELQAGMAGYEPLQEGLAVLSEYLTGELNAERLRQLSGRVIAVDLITSGADFVETFRVLHKDYGIKVWSAFMMTMRTFRGGGYTKDAVYLRGLVNLLDYLGKGKQLEPLFLGKLAQEHLPLVEELRWRKIVNPPALLPSYFHQPAARERLEKLYNGVTVTDLIKELQ